MTSNSKRLFIIAAALLCITLGAVQANAQYYTTYYSPYTSYYSPAYSSYYAPGYTSYYAPSTSYYAPAPAYTTGYGGGWYPGYFLNRIRTRLFGQPAAYVAAYPGTYAAA